MLYSGFKHILSLNGVFLTEFSSSNNHFSDLKYTSVLSKIPWSLKQGISHCAVLFLSPSCSVMDGCKGKLHAGYYHCTATSPVNCHRSNAMGFVVGLWFRLSKRQLDTFLHWTLPINLTSKVWTTMRYVSSSQRMLLVTSAESGYIFGINPIVKFFYAIWNTTSILYLEPLYVVFNVLNTSAFNERCFHQTPWRLVTLLLQTADSAFQTLESIMSPTIWIGESFTRGAAIGSPPVQHSLRKLPRGASKQRWAPQTTRDIPKQV